MERSTDAIGGSLEGTSSFFGDLNANDMQPLDTGDLDNHDGSNGTVCDEDADTPWQLVSTNLHSGQLFEEVSYAPSIRTDFSGILPEFLQMMIWALQRVTILKQLCKLPGRALLRRLRSYYGSAISGTGFWTPMFLQWTCWRKV